MRNRDYFLPSVTTLILVGMVWFLSCSHQNRLREEDDAAFDQIEEQQMAESPEAEETAKTEQADEANNSDLAQAPVSENKQESEPSSVSPQEAPPIPEQASAAPSTELNEEQAVNSEPPQQAFIEPESSGAEVQIEEVPAPKVRKSYSARVPKIPKKAFNRSGSKLNRFYFARKGDSPLKASQLLYSNSKLTKKLARWNGKVWAPGQVIFYTSPVDPKDKKMVSFYEERNIQPEEYQVKSGDWLTRIAHKKLGSMKSWKEIAVINQLKTPGSIEVGQSLAVYPKNLFQAAQSSQEQRQAKLEERLAPPVQQPKTEPLLAKPVEPAPVFENKIPEPAPQIAPAPETPPPPVQAPVAQEPQMEQAEDEGSNQVEQPSPAMNWNQLIEQNSIAILIGAALIILLLALTARKKRLKMRAASSSKDRDSGSTEDTPSKFGRR